MVQPPAPALPGEYVPATPTFQDWGQVIQFTPRLYYRPDSVDAMEGWLTDLMKGGYRPNSIRIPGSMHSCSNIFADDVILDVRDLPRTVEYAADHSTVVASTNWRLHDFLAEIGTHGKSLTATGGTDAQTLAGLISTNTAPATRTTTIYELVDWVEYLTVDPATGTVGTTRVSRGEPAFRAAICSLGALGILTRAQWRLVDTPYLASIQEVLHLNDVLGDIEATSAKYQFWRINWIPNSDKGLLWTATPIDASQSSPTGDYPADHVEGILKFVYKEIDGKLLGHKGPLLDKAMELVLKGAGGLFGTVKANGPLRNMLPVDRWAPLHVAMAEWSFDPSDLPKAMDTCRTYFKASHWPNLPIEIELTKTDDHYMSPWNWPGLDFIVKMNFQYLTDTCTVPEKQIIHQHLHGLWQALDAAGIPFKAHWGKLNSLDHATVQARYGLKDFAPYIQPMFVNPYLRSRLFGG